jgi:hypothetical protein
VSYEQDLITIVQQNPITPVGMTWGWQVADELLKADKENEARPLTHAAWKLINSRFGFERIGSVTSYTLQYMSGFIFCDRIVSIASGQPPAPITRAASDWIGSISKSSYFVGSKNFLMGFADIISAEYYAVSQNVGIKSAADKINLLTQYYYFNRGFASGIILASDYMFGQIAQTSYNSGYDQGFRDGYSAGFVAGWVAGYASGYQTAWTQANATIQQLQSTINTLQTQLSTAESNGGGGFWDTVGNIASTAGTVIGAIASFF